MSSSVELQILRIRHQMELLEMPQAEQLEWREREPERRLTELEEIDTCERDEMEEDMEMDDNRVMEELEERERMEMENLASWEREETELSWEWEEEWEETELSWEREETELRATENLSEVDREKAREYSGLVGAEQDFPMFWLQDWGREGDLQMEPWDDTPQDSPQDDIWRTLPGLCDPVYLPLPDSLAALVECSENPRDPPPTEDQPTALADPCDLLDYEEELALQASDPDPTDDALVPVLPRLHG